MGYLYLFLFTGVWDASYVCLLKSHIWQYSVSLYSKLLAGLPQRGGSYSHGPRCQSPKRSEIELDLWLL